MAEHCASVVDTSFLFAGSLALSVDGATMFDFKPVRTSPNTPSGRAVVSANYPDSTGLVTLAGNGTTDVFWDLCALNTDLYWMDTFRYVRTIPQAGGSMGTLVDLGVVPTGLDDRHLSPDYANNRLVLFETEFISYPTLNPLVFRLKAIDLAGSVTTLDTYTATTFATDRWLYDSNPYDAPVVTPDGAVWGMGQIGNNSSSTGTWFIWRWTLGGGFVLGTDHVGTRYMGLWPMQDNVLRVSSFPVSGGGAIGFPTDVLIIDSALTETSLICAGSPADTIRRGGRPAMVPTWSLTAFPELAFTRLWEIRQPATRWFVDRVGKH